LKQQGHSVIGCFIKIWRPEFVECTWKEDRIDAMRVCTAIDIPFLELDLSDAYKRDVVDEMIKNYARGITPNPDVLCNRYIKFGAFAQWAFDQGAEKIATGHYAQNKNGTLLKARDAAKDQTYFLYQLQKTALLRTIFPIGDLLKSEVRELAKRFGLPNAAKKDSQGLCFIGEVSMRDFLARYIPVHSGHVVDLNGNSIGKHEGAALYTIGQRHGFTTSNVRPHYIVKIDTARNILHVSGERLDAAVNSVLLDAIHWIDPSAAPRHASAQCRYHEQPVEVSIEKRGNELKVTFAQPHIASPGQSLVLYNGEVCLGGGGILKQ
jgi:tRNA-specific 2-thiouridylase